MSTILEQLLTERDSWRDRALKVEADSRQATANLIGERNKFRFVLLELVEVRDIKQRLGKTAEYERRQPKAWEAAMDALNLSPGSRLRQNHESMCSAAMPDSDDDLR